MSITALINTHPKRNEVRERLDEFLPDFERSIDAPTLVASTFRDRGLVGVAFDYAARMELAHRAPKAIAGEWIAESALEYLRGAAKRHATAITKAARSAESSWPAASSARFDAIAEHASRLAPLDVVLRSRGESPPPELTDADHAELAAEVRALLAVAGPLWTIASAKRLALNPVLGLMGLAADADVIADDLVLDIKTSREPVLERDQMRQVVAYACLAAYAPGSKFRSIRRVGVYQARTAVLRTVSLRGDEMDHAATGLFLHETSMGVKLAFESASEAARAAVATLRAMGEPKRKRRRR